MYKSRKSIKLIIELIALIVSFVFALVVRYFFLKDILGSALVVSTYVKCFVIALVSYIFIFCFQEKPRLERKSYKEIFFHSMREQTLFITIYILIFFIGKQAETVSRVVIITFYLGNTVGCSVVNMLYHSFCISKSKQFIETTGTRQKIVSREDKTNNRQHVYIVGSKSIGQYGGFESFVMNLLQQHVENKNIKYLVACKANGDGYMNLSNLKGAQSLNENEFTYYNAHCFMIRVPEKIGSAQAIYYDLAALKWCCKHIVKNHIDHPIVYILASRVGPFEKKYVETIHDANGLVFQNPDGWEHARRKWNYFIRKYWKLSEKYAVKFADLVICDSKHIEEYIKDEYSYYHPKTEFIAYGSHINPSLLSDDDPKYLNWLADHNLVDRQFYLSVGRFVPENNFEIMIREFIKSKTTKDFAIITTENGTYAKALEQKLQYKRDKRIKFVGTVYDPELLGKIRKNAYGYFHGHEVGGTNPSLLEALGSTNLNLLYDVGFNREVAEDAALYWSSDEGNLATLIDYSDKMSTTQIDELGNMAKKRIEKEYCWEAICDKYYNAFTNLF